MNPALSWPAAAQRTRHRAFSGLVVAAHVGIVLALWQLDVVRRAVTEAAPLMVQIVRPAPTVEERPLPLPAAPPRVLPPPVVLTVPPVEVERPAPPPVLAVQVAVPPPAPLQATPAPVVVAAVAPPSPPPPAPAPLKVAASQLRYLVEPPIEVPRASRRLREQGTVVVHVLVDVQGLPRQVSLARSSGFDRLDQQALSAMRQARFAPCRADGRPVECEADAPFLYELE